MGRLFLLELHESHPGQDLIVCRICGTHLAVVPGHTFAYQMNGITGPLLDKVVNVHVDKSITRRIHPYTVQDAHCNKCCDLLGLKFVEIPEEEVRFVEAGEILLNMKKIAVLTPELETIEYVLPDGYDDGIPLGYDDGQAGQQEEEEEEEVAADDQEEQEADGQDQEEQA